MNNIIVALIGQGITKGCWNAIGHYLKQWMGWQEMFSSYYQHQLGLLNREE